MRLLPDLPPAFAQQQLQLHYHHTQLELCTSATQEVGHTLFVVPPKLKMELRGNHCLLLAAQAAALSLGYSGLLDVRREARGFKGSTRRLACAVAFQILRQDHTLEACLSCLQLLCMAEALRMYLARFAFCAFVCIHMGCCRFSSLLCLI